MKKKLIAISLTATFVALVGASASAQTFTNLLSFTGTGGQFSGEWPYGDLTISGSTMYGTTELGGTKGIGNIFSIGVNGTNYQNLLSLSGGTNGNSPYGNLALSGSTLYGMTNAGGSSAYGSVFSIGVNGTSYQNLLSFSGTNGQYPYGGLTFSGSTLYGMTYQGGATYQGGTSGDGEVFSVGTNGTNFQNLFSFGPTTGTSPYFCSLALSLNGSTLYGMTSQAGTRQNGTVFSIGVNGMNYQILRPFGSGNDGSTPYGSLTLSGSTLYGMTELGGSDAPYGDGNIFSIGVNGANYQNLLSFSGTNGLHPIGGLTLSGSTLYGLTAGGGPSGYGNIFSIGIDGTNYQNLFSFSGTNGGYPYGDLTLSGSTLYGTTQGGGPNNNGTVFALNVAPATVALASPQNAKIITGGTAALGATLSNLPNSGNSVNFSITAAVQAGNAVLGPVSSGAGTLVPGSSQSCTISATSTTLGNNTISFAVSAPIALSGTQTATATLTVLDHAAAAFAGGGGTLNLSFGTLHYGSGTQSMQFQIENLSAAYRAGLDLDLITDIADADVFSTDAMTFTDLAAGAESGAFDLFLNTSEQGQFSGQYQFNLSDEKDLSGHAGAQTLTLNVTADVVPEPSTLTLIVVGMIGLAGFRVRRYGGESRKPESTK